MEREEQGGGWALFVKTGLPQAYTYWKETERRRKKTRPHRQEQTKQNGK